ncbi:hypothetical protein JM66_10475 [Aeromonas bestiarum]|nr:hypothetical protein JM66_10475 [Aeromonas bestiarum]
MAFFQCLNKTARLLQAIVSSCVKPGATTPNKGDIKLTALKVEPIKIRDFQFFAIREHQLFSQ